MKGYGNTVLTNNFYVYEWFIIDTDHIFHVGKGQGNRYLELKGRNKYFLRIAKKYNVASRIYKADLTEDEAWSIEKSRIKELQAIGQCETNVHEGGCGGDTVTRMADNEYIDFCKKVGQKTLERNSDPDYYSYWLQSVTTAMQRPEVKQKISQRTKESMSNPEVYELMWDNGKASPILLVINSKYKLFKTVTDFRSHLNQEYDLGGRWCQLLMKQPFKFSYQTKHNSKLKNFEGARAYKIPKKLFRSVTTMADECKPVGEILSLIEAHNN